jgi:WD40-like Beta Propeller Repeat
MRRAVAAALAVLAAAGCRVNPRPPAQPVLEDLPAGRWRVVARHRDQVLLAADREIARGVRRRDDPRRGRAEPFGPELEVPTLIFERGRVRPGPTARHDPRPLVGAPPRDTLMLHSVPFAGRTVVFAQTGNAPHPVGAPGEPGRYVLEVADRLWLLDERGIRRLTADTVGNFRHAELQAMTREGESILYWASWPLWSPDGSRIAYVTNRSHLRAGTRGQEIWLLDLATGREWPLLSEPGGVAFSPYGWLGEELVYTDNRGGGLSAVNTRTGRRRFIALAAGLGLDPAHRRLAYMEQRGDSIETRRVRVVTGGRTIDVPPAPPGFAYTHATPVFSPDGRRVLLEASTHSGESRVLLLVDLDAGRVQELLRWSLGPGRSYHSGWPAWLDRSTILIRRTEYGTGRESSQLLRLP